MLIVDQQSKDRYKEKSSKKMDDLDEIDIDRQEGKETTSDGENKKTELASSNEQKDNDSVTGEESDNDCILVEDTETVIDVDMQVDETELDNENEDSQKKKSLKRTNSEEDKYSVTKKFQTYLPLGNKNKKEEKSKEKLPLKTLSLSEFMKTKKNNNKMTMTDLEEFCIQKISEITAYKTQLKKSIRKKVKMQQQLIATMTQEIRQVKNQARELQFVNEKLLNDLKQQNPTQKPLKLLKMARSIKVQVNIPSDSSSESTQKRKEAKEEIQNQITINKNLQADSKSTASSTSFINFTYEDDKKQKNKLLNKDPLSTSPVRVNASSQKITLATAQNTSVVTSNASQLMYLMPKVLNCLPGSKTVLVNTPSVIQALNKSAILEIPKQNNTILLKEVTPAKFLPLSKPIQASIKHPAPLPLPPFVRVNADNSLKLVPPKPSLSVCKIDTGIILQWNIHYALDVYEIIHHYELYAYQEKSVPPSTDMWRKLCNIQALPLPMACTVTKFADENKYYFAIRAVDIHERIGMFSDPVEISF